MNISKSETYGEHLNQYNVIHLCLNRLSDKGGTYDDYISFIRNSIKQDIMEAYPELGNREYCGKLRSENVKKIFAVGISYDTGEKTHQCLIEEI